MQWAQTQGIFLETKLNGRSDPMGHGVEGVKRDRLFECHNSSSLSHTSGWKFSSLTSHYGHDPKYGALSPDQLSQES